MANSWSGDRTSFPPRVRARILKRDPTCVICGDRPSTIADHEPNYRALVRAGVPNPHDEQYGQGVCGPCHEVKTREEQVVGRACVNPKRKGRPHPSDPGATPRSTRTEARTA